ncbi:pyruvate kinase [Aureococcus anophagefferens]|nr:pyruvate kinase [Aureococcus anophagefferens]
MNTGPSWLTTAPTAQESVTATDFLHSLPAAGDISDARFRKGVKQVSTLGPASASPEMIEKLFLAGTDVFRMNLSHGAEDKLEASRIVRSIEAKYDHPIGILADLQGPKHRVGMFPESAPKVFLERGDKYRFDLDVDAPGDGRRVSLPHPEVLEALNVGDAILLDDGKLRVEVEAKGPGFVDTVVQNDAWLSSRKGFNLPDTVVPCSAMTPKDIEDLEFLMEGFQGVTVDWIALSFVQRPEDMLELKRRINGRSNAKLLAKLEKPQAVEPAMLRALVDVCDGIMVAAIWASRANVRTSRRRSSTAAAIMLSGESAAGKYPEESVAMQRRLVERVETAPRHKALVKEHAIGGFRPELDDDSDLDALALAASSLASSLDAKALLVFTTTGSAAQRMARLKPGVPILAVTPSPDVARALTLSAYVYPALLDPAVVATERSSTFYKMLEAGLALAHKKHLAGGLDCWGGQCDWNG